MEASVKAGLLRRADAFERHMLMKTRPAPGLLRETLDMGEPVWPVLLIKGMGTLHLSQTGVISVPPSTKPTVNRRVDQLLDLASAAEKPLVFAIAVAGEDLWWGQVQQRQRRKSAKDTWHLQLQPLPDTAAPITEVEAGLSR